MDWIYLAIAFCWTVGAVIWLHTALNTDRPQAFAVAALYALVAILNLAVSVMYHVNP